MYASAYPAYLWITHTLHTSDDVLVLWNMAKKQAEKATAAIRIFPSTRRRLNIEAAKKSITLARFIDELLKV